MTCIQAHSIADDLPRLAVPFIVHLRDQLERLGLWNPSMPIDHVCYRVDTLARYEELKLGFAACAELLSEAMVNGRPIASYRLRTPLELGDGRTVGMVELPAPKPNTPYPEGFDHIEVVVPVRLSTFMEQHPEKNFNVKNLSTAINADISLKLDGGLVKFHEASLEGIIAEEQRALLDRPHPWVVVVDLDDTLVASKTAFLLAVQDALGSHLRTTIDMDRVTKAARPTFPDFFAGFGITDPGEIGQVIEQFQTAWPRHASRCQLPVGTQSLISCLRNEGAQIHVWTARDLVTSTSILDASGFSPLVSMVHAFDPQLESKPNPSTALRAACAVSPSVYVGDSTADQAGARALGIPFLQAAWIQKAELGAPEEDVCVTPMIALSRAMKILGAPRANHPLK